MGKDKYTLINSYVRPVVILEEAAESSKVEYGTIKKRTAIRLNREIFPTREEAEIYFQNELK